MSLSREYCNKGGFVLKSTLILSFFLSFLGLVITSCSPQISDIQQRAIKEDTKVIYGDDDRLDLYEVEDKGLLDLADSTVALMQSSRVKVKSDGTADIALSSYKNSFNLCPTEPFINQKTAAFCSGSLVGKDIVITAGHCITSQSSCADTKMVFGFGIRRSDGATPFNVSAKEVYGCKEIIRRVQSGSTDYAVVRLDRAVTQHKPLKINRGAIVPNGTSLTVIGHPSGLPTKVASAGLVRSANSIYYVTSLDTYGGNSGSAVFNTETKEIVGILVRGETDFVSNGSCRVSNRCQQGGCRGEDVTRIDLLADLIPEEVVPPTPVESVTDVFSSDQQIAIPDEDENGILSRIPVNKVAWGRKIQVAVNIEHTYIGDVQITLIAPNKKTFVLRKNSGGRQQNLVGTFGKDLTSLSDLSYLSSLLVVGDWTLKVSDSIGHDVGKLKGWKLIFTP
jgi:subtilisin-like proprotein convertase family protein